MSPRASHSPGSGAAIRSALVALVVVAVALGLFLLVRARPSPGAFDPRSSDPDGTRGLVLLLEDQGATVDIARDVPTPAEAATGRRVLVLDDRLDDGQRAALVDFVRAGGVAVVADPASDLHEGGGLDDGGRRISRGGDVFSDVGPRADERNNVRNQTCDIAALQHLRGLYVDEGFMFAVRDGRQRCFGDTVASAGGIGGPRAFVVRRDLGEGTIVGLGDNGFLTNAWLRFADNSGLATALLAPQDGAEVTVLLGSGAPRRVEDIGDGDDSLSDLVRPGVWMALVQLAIAFVVFAAARGVRVGRPVPESRAVPLAGSELVRATGSMMRAARHHERAAWLLRTELHRDLCRRYRIDHGSSVEQVAWAAQDRDGVEPSLVRRALTLDATDDRSLLDLARSVDDIRQHLDRHHLDRHHLDRADANASEGAHL